MTEPQEPCLTNANGRVVLGGQQTSPSNLRKMTAENLLLRVERQKVVELSEVKLTQVLSSD